MRRGRATGFQAAGFDAAFAQVGDVTLHKVVGIQRGDIVDIGHKIGRVGFGLNHAKECADVLIVALRFWREAAVSRVDPFGEAGADVYDVKDKQAVERIVDGGKRHAHFNGWRGKDKILFRKHR
jgi:hypothetical protein